MWRCLKSRSQRPAGYEASTEAVQKDETTQQHTERNPEVNVSHNGAEKVVFGRLIIGHPAPHAVIPYCVARTMVGQRFSQEQSGYRQGGRKVRRSLPTFMGNLNGVCFTSLRPLVSPSATAFFKLPNRKVFPGKIRYGKTTNP
jgi:hypothetical protein